MVVYITIPALVCLAGLLIYALATNPKLVRIGEIMFFCGLLATLLIFGEGRVIRL